MRARWPMAQGGRVGRAGESSAFCPPTQPCRKLVVFVFFWRRCGEPTSSLALRRGDLLPWRRKNKKNSTARARGHKRANTKLTSSLGQRRSARQAPPASLTLGLAQPRSTSCQSSTKVTSPCSSWIVTMFSSTCRHSLVQTTDREPDPPSLAVQSSSCGHLHTSISTDVRTKHLRKTWGTF